MEKYEVTPKTPYSMQLLMLIGLSGLGSIIGMAAPIFLGAALGIDLEAISLDMSYRELNYLKGLQALASLLMFLLPPIVFILVQRKNAWSYLKMNRLIRFLPLLLVPLMLLTIYPALNVLMEWNSALKLPAVLNDYQEMFVEWEAQAAEMTRIYLQMHHWGDLMLNVFVMALIPAFVEEILFRGVLQQLLERWTKNPHLAIFITGAAFSAIHFQFFGFFGRWALGIWLGYLFYWSRNLWYPIIAHLCNNGILVVLIYFKVVEPPSFPAESPETPIWQVLGATAIFVASAFAFKTLMDSFRQERLRNE